MNSFIFQTAANLDTPAILGIVSGLFGAALAAFATMRSSKLSTKVTETAAVLIAWKDFATAQAAQADTRSKERILQSASQDARILMLENKLESAVLKFNECEKKHAKLEGKFESLGMLQQTQTLKINEQSETQNVQANRQDVQETRQNEQEERQNLIEQKAVETNETVFKSPK